MKQSEVEVGGTYLARVSGRIVRIKVIRSYEAERRQLSRYGPEFDRWVTRMEFEARNLETGREIRITAQRLRCRVRDCERCGEVARVRLKPTTTLGRPGEVLCLACFQEAKLKRAAEVAASAPPAIQT